MHIYTYIYIYIYIGALRSLVPAGEPGGSRKKGTNRVSANGVTAKCRESTNLDWENLSTETDRNMCCMFGDVAPSGRVGKGQLGSAPMGSLQNLFFFTGTFWVPICQHLSTSSKSDNCAYLFP